MKCANSHGGLVLSLMDPEHLWRVILCLTLFVSVSSCRKRAVDGGQETSVPTPVSTKSAMGFPAPPDLSACTRVEVKYEPSILVYACYNQESVLTKEELAYVQSQGSFVVVDRDAIKQLGDTIRAAVYDPNREGRHPGRMSINTRVAFRCYKETQLLASFVWHLGHIVCDDGHWYRLVNTVPCLSVLTPQIEPFRLRCQCVMNLRNLKGRFSEYVRSRKAYPPAATWCDAFMTYYAEGGYTMDVRRFPYEVKCPGAGEGRCHYAMNCACEPNSPKETVLLFETAPGWNQHGGPELFTFDNHEPRGGLVLLNDGTVKFVRTEEELKQLRWK